jgi:hypothetical protein
MKIAVLLGAAIVAVASQATGANAGTFTSSAAFSAATEGLSSEDYGSYSAGTLISSGSTLGALTYNRRLRQLYRE